MSLGRKIKQARIGAGLEQEDLAAALGTKQQTISTYETDHTVPREQRLAKIAQICGVSVDFLKGSGDSDAHRLAAPVAQDTDVEVVGQMDLQGKPCVVLDLEVFRRLIEERKTFHAIQRLAVNAGADTRGEHVTFFSPSDAIAGNLTPRMDQLRPEDVPWLAKARDEMQQEEAERDLPLSA